MKDWTGNAKSAYTTIGASNHSRTDRANGDYYATDPKATELLLQLEDFNPYIWECACGGGHISQVLEKAGYNVKNSDIVNRGYKDTQIIDFLKVEKEDIKNDYSRDIITNPPYKQAQEFVEKALEISMDCTKIAMFLKVTFLEGKKRRNLFEKCPPKKIYVSSSCLKCAPNGNFKRIESSAVAYAWFIWEKGYKGDTTLKWFN